MTVVPEHFHCKIGSSPATTNQLEQLVVEWRDARLSTLEVKWGDPAIAKANVALWTRYGKAESALMKYANQYLPGHNR